MSVSIPIDELSTTEIEYWLAKSAEDEAWAKYPLDAINRENEINVNKRVYAEYVSRCIDNAKAGKSPMPTISAAEAGRQRPAPQLRSPKVYDFEPGHQLAPAAVGSLEPYTSRQLVRLGFVEYPQARTSTLTNNIIAPLALRQWQISQTQKHALSPVLRLASRMMLSPASVRFIHAMCHSTAMEEMTSTRIWGIALEEYGYTKAQDAPTKELMGPVVECLNGVAKSVSWGLMDKHAEEFGAFSNTNAVTIRKRKSPGSKRKGGDGSRILFSHAFIEALEALHLSHPQAPEHVPAHLNRMLRLQLFIAKIVCHELTHAVTFYTRPQWLRDPFFGSYGMTELGSSWEQEVLGGVIDWWDFAEQETLDTQLQRPLSIRKWPSTGDYGDYIYMQDPGLNASEYLRRYPKESTTLWYLDMRWMDRLFHDEFWQSAGDSLELLKPPRTFGYRWMAVDKRFVDPLWRASMSSEARSVDRKGRVLLDKRLRGHLTPSTGDEETTLTW